MSTAVVVLQLVLALGLLGLGPLARLLPDRSRLEVALCAPALGLLLMTTSTSLVVLAGAPVRGWVWPGFVVGAAASLALWRGSAPQGRRPTPRATATAVAAVSLGAVLLVAPSVAGGRAFEVLRGNGTDAFNYVGIAQLLGEHGRPRGPEEPVEALLARGRHVPVADHLVRLAARWASSAGLAWSARLVGRPPFEVTFGHALVCLLALQGPAWCLLARAGAGRWGAAAVSTALCTGAWAGLVVDLSVQSHLVVSPVIGLLLVAAASPGPGARLLTGAALGGVLLIYPEMLPFVVLGLALALGLALRDGWRPGATQVALVALGAAAVCGPFATSLVRFLLRQAHGLQAHAAFASYFQRVLLDDPLLGVTALWPLADRGAVPWTSGVLGLLASALIVAFVGALASAARGRPLVRLVCGLAAAGVLQALALRALGRPWPFAKAVTYLLPFAALGLGAATLRVGPAPRPLAGVRRAAAAAVFAWAALQLLVAADRIRVAVTGRDPPRAVPHHIGYRGLDPDARPIVEAARRAARPVTLFTGDPWRADLVSLTAGAELALTSADPTRGVAWEVIERTRRATRAADLLVVLRRCASDRLLERALATTSDLALVPADAGLAWAPEAYSWVRRPTRPREALVLHAWAPRPLQAELVIEPLGAQCRVEVRGLEGTSATASLEAGPSRVSARLALPAGFSQLEVLPARPIALDAVRLVETD